MGHRLLAEIAIVERQWDQAEAELAQALSAMNSPPTPGAVWQAYGLVPPEDSGAKFGAALPLAAWRVYATAAKLCEQLRKPADAEIYQRRSDEVRLQLAASLDEADPLRRLIVEGREGGKTVIERSA